MRKHATKLSGRQFSARKRRQTGVVTANSTAISSSSRNGVLFAPSARNAGTEEAETAGLTRERRQHEAEYSKLLRLW